MQSPVSGLLPGQSEEVPCLVDNPCPWSTLASPPVQEMRWEEGLAVADALPTLRADHRSPPVRKQGVETEEGFRAVSLSKRIERHGLRQVEGPTLGPSKGIKAGAAAKRFAEIVGKSADVEAGGHGQADDGAVRRPTEIGRAHV